MKKQYISEIPAVKAFLIENKDNTCEELSRLLKKKHGIILGRDSIRTAFSKWKVLQREVSIKNKLDNPDVHEYLVSHKNDPIDKIMLALKAQFGIVMKTPVSIYKHLAKHNISRRTTKAPKRAISDPVATNKPVIPAPTAYYPDNAFQKPITVKVELSELLTVFNEIKNQHSELKSDFRNLQITVNNYIKKVNGI